MIDAAAPGPVDIVFVSGHERDFRHPPAIAAAGLSHRLAVVQETGVDGWPDMVFDEALWRALCDFLAHQGEVWVGHDMDDLGREEWSLRAFLEDWERQAPDDRGPPGLLVVRSGGALRFCVVTEYWNEVGGPWPYADSYTYSVFSMEDLSGALPAYFREICDGRWRLSDDLLAAGAKRKEPPKRL